MEADYFFTIATAVAGSVFKDKRSKFLGIAYPVENTLQIKQKLEQVRMEHPTASHYCYAWRIGTDPGNQRAHDDGEPYNSAGAPILGQIISFGLTNLLVVVVRYYGGKKLGVGGLVNAYKNAAKNTLEASEIMKTPVSALIQIRCSYEMANRILSQAKKNDWQIRSQEMGQNCRFLLAVPKPMVGMLENLQQRYKGIAIEKIQDRSEL